MAVPQVVLSVGRHRSKKVSGVRPRSLAPKEHGAWGQLLIPLVVALGLGRPGLVAWGLALAVVAVFMAHEPLLVLLGQRGTRATREAAGSARRSLGLLLGAATVIGGAVVVGGNSHVRLAVAASLGLLVVAVFGFLLNGQERSVSGELWLSATLPFAAIPVALASGVSPLIALVAWQSFSLAYAAGIFGVRGIIQDARENKGRAGWVGLGVTLVATVGLLIQSVPAGSAALLFWTVVAAVRALRPGPKALKRVGWLLVGASVVQALWLLAALRGA